MTTPYHVKVAPAAAEYIKKMSVKHRKQIFKVAEALAINPRPPGAKKIEGMTGLYIEPVNGWRIIYKIEDQDVLLLTIKER